MIGGGVERLEECQCEVEVAQRKAHRAIAGRSVPCVDDAVAIGVHKIRAAHADEGVDIGCANGHHGDLLGHYGGIGVAVGDAHRLCGTALAERELAGDMEEVRHRQGHIARHLEQIALAEINNAEHARVRTEGDLQTQGAAPCIRVGSGAGGKVDGWNCNCAIFALVDGNGKATIQAYALDTDERSTATGRQGKVALGAGGRADGHHGLGHDDGQLVDSDGDADCVLCKRGGIVHRTIVVAIGVAGTHKGCHVAGAQCQHGHLGRRRCANGFDKQFLALQGDTAADRDEVGDRNVDGGRHQIGRAHV